MYYPDFSDMFIKLLYNRYWGWGGEDDDLYKRITSKGLKINYLNETIGRFKVQ